MIIASDTSGRTEVATYTGPGNWRLIRDRAYRQALGICHIRNIG